MDTGTRTGIVYLADDGSDAVTAYRTSIRNTVAWAEAQGALYAQGLLSARPAAGKAGRLYRATDDATGVVYYDDGSTWQSIGTSAAVDAAAGVGSLRTLGAGSLQAAAGNHTHAIGAITGTGDSVTKSVGTATGTVAAGDHTHTVMTGVQSVIKTTATSRTSDATIYDDPELQLTLAAGTWHVTALISAQGGQSGDISTQWSFSGTTSVKIHGMIGPAGNVTGVTSGGSAVSYASGNFSGDSFGLDGSVSSFIHVHLILVVTVSGTLIFRWGQAFSNGTATQVNAGSTVIAEKIA